MFATYVVAVSFGNRSQRYLTYLCSTSHNNDPLSIDFLERLHRSDGSNYLKVPKIGYKSF
jgi:hypothetical protein